jgi:hypothetical protein
MPQCRFRRPLRMRNVDENCAVDLEENPTAQKIASQ